MRHLKKHSGDKMCQQRVNQLYNDIPRNSIYLFLQPSKHSSIQLSECLRKADTSTLDANTIVWNRRSILYISKQYQMLNMRKWRPTPSLTKNNSNINNNNKISQLSLLLLLNDCDNDASGTTSPKDIFPSQSMPKFQQSTSDSRHSFTHSPGIWLFICMHRTLVFVVVALSDICCRISSFVTRFKPYCNAMSDQFLKLTCRCGLHGARVKERMLSQLMDKRWNDF